MPGPQMLSLSVTPSLTACNAGLFISRSQGTHPDRVIDTSELIFVRSGRLDMFEGDRLFTVQAGQSLLLWQGRRHGGSRPYPPDLSFYWIHFRLKAPPDSSRPSRPVRIPQHAAVRRPDRLTELYRQFLDDQETGRLRPESAALIVTLMLCEVADTRPPLSAADDSLTALAAQADRFIRLHHREPLSASRLAAGLRCNPDYLGRVFQKAYGCTLTDAIHRHRLQEARALLMEEKLSIKEIALACGYADPGYFRRLFRRQQGLTPVAFRRLYSHLHVNTE